MADETQSTVPPATEAVPSDQAAAVLDIPEKELPPPTLVSVTESEVPLKSPASKEEEEVVVVETLEKRKPIDESKLPQNLVSFKEESNRVADLSDFEQKALQELKYLVQDALNNHKFTSPPPPPPLPKEAAKMEEKETSTQEVQKTQEIPAVSTEPTSDTPPPPPATETPIPESEITPQTPLTHEPKPEEDTPAMAAVDEGVETVPKQQTPSEEEVPKTEEEIFIWGIPLLKDDRSDVILLKFLRARDFKVKDAFTMIKNTIQWRKDFGIDALLDEDLGDDLEKVVFMHGFDREGHPVCFNVYGEFQNKELYSKTFSDEAKRMKFLRWRIQFLERSIRKLDFSPGGISSLLQVTDLKNSPGPGKRDHRLATKQALHLLQDNYPEFAAKQVFINVPWWYLAFYTMISPFLTQRTKSKFVFASPSKSAETLFKYISPEQVPVQYGGLSVDYCDCNPEFSIVDPVTEVTVKPATKQIVEIIIYEKCIIVWELRVVGWEVSYSAEFVPNAEDMYTVIIQKATKMAPTDEPAVYNSFKVGELGKILLTIDNPTSKKKKLLYRFKVKPLCD
ncbi:hypothetical protein L1049_025756 [Liquidambar formosana]|uniref:Patellin-3 n=1 Tax=Liquidambar formosana TaxID=63359 RepID=A0AAP0R5V4_LIQFO